MISCLPGTTGLSLARQLFNPHYLVEKECEKIGYREKGDSHEGEQGGQASRNDVESRAGD
jgi:hypothetical protein